MLLIETQHIINHDSHRYKITSNDSVVIHSNNSDFRQNCSRYYDKVVYDVFFKWLILSARFFHSSNGIYESQTSPVKSGRVEILLM